MQPTPEQTDHDGIDVRRLAAVLRRRSRLVLGVTLLVTALAVAYTALQEREYSATAAVLFRDPGFDQRLFGTQFLNQSADPDRDAATNLELASLSVVARATADALGETYTARAIKDAVRVESVGRSDVVNITATDRYPQAAARIANTFAREFVRIRRDADRAQIAGAQKVVQQQLDALSDDEREGAQGQSLAERGQELRILASLQTGKAELAQTAQVPESPSGPRPRRNAALGMLLGLMLGLVSAFLREKFDRRIRDADEVDAIVNHPVLAGIPEFSRSAAQPGTLVRDPAATEAFRMLRTNLRYFNVDREMKTILVTSAGPSDGKSTAAANLAYMAAESGARTLLIEADLRHPTLARLVGLPQGTGLSDVLSQRVSTAEAKLEVPGITAATSRTAAAAELDLLPSGPTPPNPSQLLESGEMQRLVRDAADDYDYVVIDTPPIAIVPDAVPLIKLVDAVLIVARLGMTDRSQLRRLNEQLERLEAPVLGVILNSVAATDGYAYGYAYGLPGSAAEEHSKVGAGS